MRTNLEKWAYYYDKVNEKIDNFIDDNIDKFQDYLNLTYFYVKGLYTESYTVIDIQYEIPSSVFYKKGKKPTRVQVNKLKSMYEEDFSIENINLIVEYKYKYGSTNKLYTISRFKKEVLESNKYIFSLDEANALYEKNLKKKQEEDALINAGTHFRCARCIKVTPIDEVVEQRMINFKMYGRGGRLMKFCSSECAAHEQMAHEG